MRDLVVRCARCGKFYDKREKVYCPFCKGSIADNVICYAEHKSPVVELTALIYQWPNVCGLPVTSRN